MSIELMVAVKHIQNLNSQTKFQLFMYAEIANWDPELECFVAWPSKTHMAYCLSCTTKTVQNNNKLLEKDEYGKIIKRKRANGSYTSNLFCINHEKLIEAYPPLKKHIEFLIKANKKDRGYEDEENEEGGRELNSPGWGIKFPRVGNLVPPVEPLLDPLSDLSSCEESKKENKLPVKKTNKNKEVSELETKVNEVWEAFKEITKKTRYKLDKRRRQAIQRALEHYGVDELKTAFKGWLVTPFYQRDNRDGKVIYKLEVILRGNDSIDELIENAVEPPKPKSNHTGSGSFTNINDQKKQAAEIAEKRERKLFDRAFGKGGSDVKGIE